MLNALNIGVKLSKSLLSHGLHGEDQVGHHQLLFSLFHGGFLFGEGSLETLVEHRSALSSEDIILALHLLIFGDFAALNGEDLEHLHLLERTAEILDEALEALDVLQAEQGVQNLLVYEVLPARQQLPE